ncbi:MAG: DUF3105 domain-containing protein [Candidatus Magasanikbacteria bacterium]|nr:DUF3105 domain-containing protein [Candidatus Magasanikbacteria bacterium]
MKKQSPKDPGYLVVIVIVGFLLVLFVWWMLRPLPGQEVPNLGNHHLKFLSEEHIPYNSKPPTSGPHVGYTAAWGISDKQLPDEVQVHNLEDAGVIIHYDPAHISSDTLKQLIDIVQPRYLKNEHILLEPYVGIETPIVLTAWTRIEKLSTFNKEQIEKFINAFIGIDHHVPGGE